MAKRQLSTVTLALTLLMAGCATTGTTTITVPPKYTDNVPIPKVQPTQLGKVNWQLMNKAQMQEFLANSKEDFVVYALDDENVAILIGNIQELRRVILSQQEVIEYLKTVLDARTEKKEETK